MIANVQPRSRREVQVLSTRRHVVLHGNGGIERSVSFFANFDQGPSANTFGDNHRSVRSCTGATQNDSAHPQTELPCHLVPAAGEE